MVQSDESADVEESADAADSDGPECAVASDAADNAELVDSDAADNAELGPGCTADKLSRRCPAFIPPGARRKYATC